MKNSIRWVTLGAVFLIPLLPFVVANSYFFPFITGKNFDFRILVEIAFAGWAYLAFADVKYRPRFSWTAILLGLFTIWMAVADALGVNPAKAFWSNFERMDGWVTLIHLLMLFLVMGSMFTVDKLWQKWWFTFLAISALICAYSLLQVAHVLAIHQGGVRLDATFGNSDYLACYMLFAIAVSVWQSFAAKNTVLRWSLIVLSAFEVIVLFYTATRGAILGFVGAAVFGALLWIFESGKQGRKYAGGTLLVFLVLIGGFFLIRNEPWIQKDPTFSRIATISLADPETHTRLTIWHMAYEGFLEKPIHGWGQEGFNYVFNKYYEPSLYNQEPWFDRAHNMYLDWLIAGGAPALLLYLALLLSAVIALYRSDMPRAERILLLSGLAAYCFQGLFVFDNLFSYVPFIAFLAMAHGISSRPINRLEKAPIPAEATMTTVALPIVFVALVLALWFVNVPSMSAAGDLIVAISPAQSIDQNIALFKKAFADNSFAQQEITEQLVTFTTTTIGSQDPTITSAQKQELFTYATQQMNALVTLIPNDARIRLEYTLLLRSGGDFADALKQIGIAEQLSPHKQSIITEQGVDEWESGNPAAANAAFQKAYAIDTSVPALASYAAAGDIITNNLPAAKALLLQAHGTTTVTDDVVMLAYYQTKDYPDFINSWQLRVAQSGGSVDSEFGYAEALANGGQIAAAKAVIQAAITQHPEAATQGTQILNQINAIGG